MIGAIAGDIVGSLYERDNIKTKNFPLFGDRCFFTDDSILTIALADTIMSGTPYAENLKTFYQWYPAGGYGGSFRRWARSRHSEPYNSWGNGAAMRISPVGYAFDDLETVLSKAEEYTAITHNHPEGIKGGQSVAAAIFLARSGKSKADIRQYIETQFGYDLSRHVDEIRPTYSFDVSSQGTVPQAVRAFLDSTDFEDAIRTAISLGGDSDTLACITGGIAQAFYRNVPIPIQSAVYKVLDNRLGLLTLEFMQRHCEFTCELTALGAYWESRQRAEKDQINDPPSSACSPSSKVSGEDVSFRPGSFRFKKGDVIYLKTGEAFVSSRKHILESIEANGLSNEQSWIPTEAMTKELADVPMTIVMSIVYHCGYRLHFLSFKHRGQSMDFRFCEAFLTTNNNSNQLKKP
jgi:ADP-ribosylglycohydrolase